jgi:pentalenene oxygenase
MALLRDPHGFIRSLPRFGELVRVKIGPFETIVVCDPSLAREIYLDDRTYDKGGPLYDRIREVTGDGAMVSMRFSDHRRHRHLLQPTFHRSRLQGYAYVMSDEADTLAHSWKDGQDIDTLTEMHHLTARCALLTMFASTLPRAVLERSIRDSTTVVDGIFKRAITPKVLRTLPLPANIRYNQAIRRIRNILDEVIRDYRATGIDHGDFLSALLTARDPNGDRLTDDEIKDEVITFFLAGMDTTAITTAWALHLVAETRSVQEQLQAEVDTEVTGTAAMFDELPKLKLTCQIINEVLRLYPAVWLTTRTTTKETRLNGHHLPTGSSVLISPYQIHHRADLFPEPESFQPDRWLDPQLSSPPRCPAIPFGVGARKCIGDAFGQTEATLILATIAKHWHLEPRSSARVKPAGSFLLYPRGLTLRVTARGPLTGHHPEALSGPA